MEQSLLKQLDAKRHSTHREAITVDVRTKPQRAKIA
jgi:hypothetical protein